MLVNRIRWNSAKNISPHLSATFFLRTNAQKRPLSTVQNHSVQERKFNVDGVNINCLRVGTGEHPVLLIPGAAGSIWTDFKPQIEGLDGGKFTIVAWDPPGYGKSRPPARSFPDDFFQRDATWAFNLMKVLGYTKFSLIGWSGGGITSWSENMRAPLIAVYGEEYLRNMWTSCMDTILRICKKQNGDLCKESLSKIKCPTLIVQGSKDAMVLPEHATYLRDHIVGAKLETFEKGAHNLHLRYAEEFNALVTKFLIG